MKNFVKMLRIRKSVLKFVKNLYQNIIQLDIFKNFTNAFYDIVIYSTRHKCSVYKR